MIYRALTNISGINQPDHDQCWLYQKLHLFRILIATDFQIYDGNVIKLKVKLTQVNMVNIIIYIYLLFDITILNLTITNKLYPSLRIPNGKRIWFWYKTAPAPTTAPAADASGGRQRAQNPQTILKFCI